jgi:hypothetical protein
MARVSTDPDAAAQVVQLLLSFLASAVFDAKGRTDSLGRDSDSRQAGGHHVAQAALGRLFADASATMRCRLIWHCSAANEARPHARNFFDGSH